MTAKMITAKNVSYSYGSQQVLGGISFDVAEGDFVAVLGPNGAGKTTLMKLIMGLLPMQKGTLDIGGTPVRKLAGRDAIGYIPQKYSVDRLFPGTVQEILKAQSVKESQLHPQLGIHELLHRKFVELSGGQQQKVLISLALQNDPKVLILDEPTVGVDMKTEEEFLRLLKHINVEHGITILLVTHDVGMVPSMAKNVLCINHNVCCMGPSSEAKKLVKEMYSSSEVHHHHA